MTMKTSATCHCGREISRSQKYALEHRLDTLCYACAKARCDESPEVCPFVSESGSTFEEVSSRD